MRVWRANPHFLPLALCGVFLYKTKNEGRGTFDISPISFSSSLPLISALLSHWFTLAIKVYGNRLIEGVGLYSSGTMCDKQSIPLPSTNIAQQPTQKEKGNANKMVVLHF